MSPVCRVGEPLLPGAGRSLPSRPVITESALTRLAAYAAVLALCVLFNLLAWSH